MNLTIPELPLGMNKYIQIILDSPLFGIFANIDQKELPHVRDFASIIPMIFILAFVRIIVVWFGERIGRAFIDYNDPQMKKLEPKKYSGKINKLKDQSVKLTYHTFITLAGHLYFRTYDFWFPTTHRCEEEQDGHAFGFRFYYMFQMAYHVQSLIHFALFEKESRSDDLMMHVHHIVTVLLIGGSYLMGLPYTCVGALVFWVHDASDVFIALAKFFNNSRFKSLKVLVPLYLGIVVSWAVFRLYLFSAYIIFPVYMHNNEHREEFGEFEYYRRMVFAGLMFTLWILHWIWFFMFFQIARAMANGRDEVDATEHYNEATSKHDSKKKIE